MFYNIQLWVVKAPYKSDQSTVNEMKKSYAINKSHKKIGKAHIQRIKKREKTGRISYGTHNKPSMIPADHIDTQM